MAVATTGNDGWGANPIDLIEEIVGANEWLFDRTSDDELMLQVGGNWCDYQLHFAWCHDVSALHFSCALDMRVPQGRRGLVNELLVMMNGALFIGHFDLTPQDGTPVFRQTLLMRGTRGGSVEQLEDLLDIAINECERHYPAFQFVIWAGHAPGDALAAAMLETVGEA